jgi:hypothetical protein
MRIRIVQKPREPSIDGIRLDRFEVGSEYDVGTTLGAVLLAEGWAIPVLAQTTEPFRRRQFISRTPDPANLIRERHPPILDQLDRAAEFKRQEDRPAEFKRRKTDKDL